MGLEREGLDGGRKESRGLDGGRGGVAVVEGELNRDDEGTKLDGGRVEVAGVEGELNRDDDGIARSPAVTLLWADSLRSVIMPHVLSVSTALDRALARIATAVCVSGSRSSLIAIGSVVHEASV